MLLKDPPDSNSVVHLSPGPLSLLDFLGKPESFLKNEERYEPHPECHLRASYLEYYR